VYDHLINSFSIDPENLRYKGYGSTQILYKNDSKTKHEVEPLKKKNRRVELRVIKRKDFVDQKKFDKEFITYSKKTKSIREVDGQLPVVIRTPEVQFYMHGGCSTDSIKATANFIRKHPEWYFQITSHTDTRGKAASNYTLSIARAKYIYNYMVEQEKIDSCQITYAGYGPKYFLVSNEEIKKAKTPQEKEELHQKNRRTELIVLGKRN
jgi:outer membrane protein OmpA-like peptidoglycan-associated protein